jgi:hypothetical protein
MTIGYRADVLGTVSQTKCLWAILSGWNCGRLTETVSEQLDLASMKNCGVFMQSEWMIKQKVCTAVILGDSPERSC